MAQLSGRSAFLQLLIDEGVTHMFGNPGTTELPIMEVIPNYPQLKYVLGLQEAVVLGMADGFGRASHRLVAANVHVAPGLGNAMGALYNAKFSGSPVIVTAGQQEQGHGLLEPLLYDELVAMARPLVKWAVEATRAADLPRIIHRAAKIALTPPTGPVFISLPGDVLDEVTEMDLGAPVRVDARNRPSDEAIESLIERLIGASRPVIISGHELAMHDAFDDAAEFAELLGAAVYQEPTPYSARFKTDSPVFMGTLNRTQKQVRATLEPFDLIICLGGDLLRMSVYSPIDPVPEGVPIVHISERDRELGKNYPTQVAIQANIKETLRAILPRLRAKRTGDIASRAEARLAALKPRNWAAQRDRARVELMMEAESTPIDPRFMVMRLTDALPKDAVVVEEALTTTATLPTFLPQRNTKALYGLASGGLGFGVPGAVGISLALPGRPIAALIGDGSAMYGVQAFWTAAHLKLPITYVIANNRSYRILKDRMVAMRSTPQFPAMDLRDPEIDYVGLAQSMGIPARRISDPNDLLDGMREAFMSGGPRLIDVTIADGYS